MPTPLRKLVLLVLAAAAALALAAPAADAAPTRSGSMIVTRYE